jgi:primosomal protein N' (replication factor Y) (superfamily II helicase)
MPAIAQVEPLRSTRALRGPFDYRLTEQFSDVGVGSLLIVPFARREVIGVVVGLADHSEVPAEKLLTPTRTLELAVPESLVELASWIAAEYCSTTSRALGLMLPPGLTRGAKPLSRLTAEITDSGRDALNASEPAKTQRLTERQRSVLGLLADAPLAAALVPGGHGALRRLADRGLLTLERRTVTRRPHHLPVGVQTGEQPELNSDQSRVFDDLSKILADRSAAERLLHGITGSGKTEIYLRAAAAALAQGRGAIIMVPEIALTPQIVGRFMARFGDTVAVLHSRLGEGERHDEWRRLRAGEARVCVGPRSAVFAPIEDLGLIVLDEEHDASYKHEGDPRYDAREVAAARAHRTGALLLMGSATPRAESYHAVPRLSLDHRVDGRPLPEVQVLDMRESNHGLHPQTVQALAAVRRAQSKAIVLLNRRGWSNFLSCRTCGRVWGCPQCDVALVLHRRDGFMSCHHCGHRETVPARCSCGSVSVARHGAGTERLQHDLDAALGNEDFQIFRLDADVAHADRQDGGVGALLREFEEARSGVLIGTQMVAKGHDFADIALGVVLDADATLRFPDFRAEERTFALIAQLAGRVGRGGEGRVLVQSMAPQARAIQLAAAHDSEAFLAGELERRAELSYPPFAHLIRIICSALDPQLANTAAQAIAKRLRSPGLTVLGPAALFRLRGRERRVLLLKTTDRAAAVRIVDEAIRLAAKTRAHAGVNFSVDVDPQ